MEVVILIARIVALGALYAMVGIVVVVIWRELKATSSRQELREIIRTAKFVVLTGGETGLLPGDVFHLETTNTVGRSLNNTIVLLDPSVSLHHAHVIFENGCWWLQDLESTNGTTLNDDTVDRKQPLRNRDVIGLGQVRLQLEDNTR